MTCNADTRPHFIAWYRDVFGFSDHVATTLYDDQLFKDALTIAEFGDSEDSVCRTLHHDSRLPIAKLAVTRLKLLTFWISTVASFPLSNAPLPAPAGWWHRLSSSRRR